MLTQHHPVRPPFAPPPPRPPSPAGRLSTSPDREGVPDRKGMVVALGCGLAFGVLLGCWCRMFAYSVSVNGVLANLASPWVAAAFVSGAVVARHSAAKHDRLPSVPAAGIAGALAGVVCLVAATVVYYGPARTGTFDFHGAVFRTVFWTGAGIAAGLVFGAAGAVWRVGVSSRVRSACLVVLGAVVVGEAGLLIVAGATRHDAFSLPVVVAVAVVGLAIPFLLAPSRQSAKSVALVALLAVPVMLGGIVLLAIAIAAARGLRAVV